MRSEHFMYDDKYHANRRFLGINFGRPLYQVNLLINSIPNLKN